MLKSGAGAHRRFVSSRIHPEVFAAAVLAFLADLSNSMTLPTFTIFARDVGSSLTFIGFLVSATSISRLATVALFGSLSDKWGRRYFISFGFTCYATSYLILTLATNPLHILLSRLVFGLAQSAIYNILMAHVVAVSKETRGISVGIYATLMGAGFSLGPVIGGFVASIWSYQTSYVLSAIVASFAVLITWFGIAKPQTVPETVSGTRISWRNTVSDFGVMLRNRNILIACLGNFFNAATIGTDVTFFPIYAKDINIRESIIGTILTARAFSSTAIRIPIGKVVDKIGSKTVMGSSLAISGVALWLVPGSTISWVLTILLALEGLGFGIFLTSGAAFVGEVSEERKSGSTMGLYYMFSSLGGIFNFTLIGIVAQIFGLAVTSRFSAMLCMMGVLTVFLGQRSMTHHTS